MVFPVFLRSSNRTSGTTNDYYIDIPVSKSNYQQDYFDVEFIGLLIEYPVINNVAYAYDSPWIEVRCSLPTLFSVDTRGNSVRTDTIGFLNTQSSDLDKSVFRLLSRGTKFRVYNDEDIFGQVRVQLLGSDGSPLVYTNDVPEEADPPEHILMFQFT